MNLTIKPSDKMCDTTSPLGNIENKLIRLPKKVRDNTDIQLHEFLSIKGKNDDNIFLQVIEAYEEDAMHSNTSGYVSNSTYDLLHITEKDINIDKVDVTVGCDPEFFLIDDWTGRVMTASAFFSTHGDVGTDYGLAELRPLPSDNEEGLVHNIRDLIIKADHLLSKRSIYMDHLIHMIGASSYDEMTAGFHLHFGLHPNVLANDILLQHISNIMDFYVGIPSIIPEGKNDAYRRSKRLIAYGKPGDYKKSYVTFEYRVPGGNLLRSPVLTLGIITLGIVVMTDIVSRIKAYSNSYDLNNTNWENKLYSNITDKQNVYDIITSKSTSKALKQIDTIFSDVSSMVGFNGKREDAILAFMTDGILQTYNGNIRDNWRVRSK